MENKKNTEKKSNKKVIIIIVAAVIVLAAATVLILALNGVFSPKSEPSNGVVGVISDNWDPGIEQTDGEAKKGTQIPGYSTAEMTAGDTSLKLSIGNPKDNKVGMYATLKLGDGTVLYKSELLKPGQGLTEVPLDKTLEKGEYDAIVEYQCVVLDENNTPLNSAESGFKLIVK